MNPTDKIIPYGNHMLDDDDIQMVVDVLKKDPSLKGRLWKTSDKPWQTMRVQSMA